MYVFESHICQLGDDPRSMPMAWSLSGCDRVRGRVRVRVRVWIEVFLASFWCLFIGKGCVQDRSGQTHL